MQLMLFIKFSCNSCHPHSSVCCKSFVTMSRPALSSQLTPLRLIPSWSCWICTTISFSQTLLSASWAASTIFHYVRVDTSGWARLAVPWSLETGIIMNNLALATLNSSFSDDVWSVTFICGQYFAPPVRFLDTPHHRQIWYSTILSIASIL